LSPGGVDEVSENFSARETFAIYGESETTVTVLRDGFSAEEKTFATMRDAVDYLRTLEPVPLRIVLRIRAHGREIPFEGENVSKLMQDL
jgi:hypothetical protein